MPIPTRSQSVRTKPAETPSGSHAANTASSIRAETLPNVKDVQSPSPLSLPQARRFPSNAAHSRSSSTSDSALPRPRASAQGSHAPGSQVPTLSRTSSVSLRGVQSSSKSTAASPAAHLRSQSINLGPDNFGTRLIRPQTSKPAFTTYQQHFSPRKHQTSSKVALPLRSNDSGVHQDGSPFKDDRYSPRLTAELLELSLVHAQASGTLKSFEASVKRMRHQTELEVSLKREEVFNLEIERQICINAGALAHWLQTHSGSDSRQTSLAPSGNDVATSSKDPPLICNSDEINPLETFHAPISSYQSLASSKIENLGDCIQELETISQPGAVLDQLCEEFNQWLLKLQGRIRTQLDLSDLGTADGYSLTIGGPSPDWSRRINETMKQVILCRRLLQSLLCGAATSSTIEHGLIKNMQLGDLILQKLQIAKDIVSAVMLLQQEHDSRDLFMALEEQQQQQQRHPSRRQGLWCSS